MPRSSNTSASVVNVSGLNTPKALALDGTPLKLSTQPTEKLFVDIVAPLTPTKLGNSAILVVSDGFSKFVCFYPVRRISSQVVIDCLERNYFPAYGTPNAIVVETSQRPVFSLGCESQYHHSLLSSRVAGRTC